MRDEWGYAEIALEDLQAAKGMLGLNMYNHASRLCQQYIEKVLKEFISHVADNNTDMQLFSSHNINYLLEEVSRLTSIKFSSSDKRVLKDLNRHYFNTNYPGSNYSRIEEPKAKSAYKDTLIFATKLQSQLQTHIKDYDLIFNGHKEYLQQELSELEPPDPPPPNKTPKTNQQENLDS